MMAVTFVTSVLEFQFHLVRLKVRRERGGDDRREEFQFHLVRLKAKERIKESGSDIVSIPFSTIKRS